MKVTATPERLFCGLNDPPDGLTVHVTPALSFVVAVTVRFSPATTLPRCGDMETVILPEFVEIVIFAEDDLVVSAMEVAVSVTVAGEGAVPGA